MKLRLVLKNIYTKDYFILLCVGFIPLLWKILEIALLAGMDNALKILGQLALISIIFKVFEESLLNPLYKVLGQDSLDNAEDKEYIAKKFLLWFVIATFLFSGIVIILNVPIMKMSQVPGYIFDETLLFLRIYIVSCLFGLISKYLYTFNVINKDTKKMFLFLLIKALSTVICFVVFVPTFSLGLGATGVAVAELIVNILTTGYLLFTFPYKSSSSAFFNKKQYFKLFVFSLLETLIRNIVYYFVILVFLNMIDNQDLYFVANDFIWSIMLVPTLAQSSLIKQDIANSKNYSLKPYFINCILLVSFIALLIPISLVVFKHIYSLTNYLEYFIVLLKLLPCYVLFVIDSVIEAYFFATGKIHHVLIQNILTNIGVYLTALILFMLKVWTISLDAILLLFNLGVVVSSIYTIITYIVITKTKLGAELNTQKN